MKLALKMKLGSRDTYVELRYCRPQIKTLELHYALV